VIGVSAPLPHTRLLDNFQLSYGTPGRRVLSGFVHAVVFKRVDHDSHVFDIAVGLSADANGGHISTSKYISLS
jgi:hypothetical protein